MIKRELFVVLIIKNQIGAVLTSVGLSVFIN